MFNGAQVRFDVASALSMGKRKTQEDAVITDFTIGTKLGIVVLADGMGGQNAGDVASNLVVTEVYSELRHKSQDMVRNPDDVSKILLGAARRANWLLSEHIALHPETAEMGCTLVILVQVAGNFHWLSVGDSAVFLMRGGKLERLNADHSLAPHIDYMARQGVLTNEQARNHPDRSVLTSAISGKKIRYVDHCEKSFSLRPGDALVVASDGLSSLQNSKIAEILNAETGIRSAQKSEQLLSAIRKLDLPKQDNVSFAIIQIPEDGLMQPSRMQAIRSANSSTAPKKQCTPGAAQMAGETLGKRPILCRLKSLSMGLMG